MSKTNVLFITSECVPFVKTGGLADVCGALPKYFNDDKYDVRVILPKYNCIPEKYKTEMQHLLNFTTGFCFREQYVGIETLTKNGIQFYFVDNEFYFGGSWPYDSVYNDIEKFAFFSRAVLSALPLLNWKPQILHCHDWQSALVPVYLNDYFQGDVFYHKMKTVMTIHNLKFQGLYDVQTVRRKTGLSEYYFTDDKLKHFDNGNLLKGGIVYADRITTVSKTYKNEVQTPYFGEGLDGLLTAKDSVFTGILNGIDTESYNPETDEALPYKFVKGLELEIKKKNKKALQKELGLPEKEDAMMVGFVSRLTDQKGLELVQCVLDNMLSKNIQFVVLGTGDANYERMFKQAQANHPDKVRAEIYFSEALSRRIYASCDLFLMPSKFEPCGLSQLLALRYGALPLVRETGGLNDTVKPYNEYTQEGTGFSFTNFNAHDMLFVFDYAEKTYRLHRKNFDDMVLRAMKQDFSWEKSTKEYEALYDELISERTKEEKNLK